MKNPIAKYLVKKETSTTEDYNVSYWNKNIRNEGLVPVVVSTVHADDRNDEDHDAIDDNR